MAGRTHTIAEAMSDTSVVDFVALHRDHWRPLLRVAQSLVDDAASAEDVVQEAFATVYRRRSALVDQQGASRYLRTAVVNGARSALRRRRTVRAHLATVRVVEYAAAADTASLLTDEHNRVRAALAGLPGRQREVLSLRFLCDLDDGEIAAVLGTSEGNVRSAASRGLTTLRASIGGQS
jgi:RNA polymerase sigma-70 factor (sigma-E family)